MKRCTAQLYLAIFFAGRGTLAMSASVEINKHLKQCHFGPLMPSACTSGSPDSWDADQQWLLRCRLCCYTRGPSPSDSNCFSISPQESRLRRHQYHCAISLLISKACSPAPCLMPDIKTQKYNSLHNNLSILHFRPINYSLKASKYQLIRICTAIQEGLEGSSLPWKTGRYAIGNESTYNHAICTKTTVGQVEVR